MKTEHPITPPPELVHVVRFGTTRPFASYNK
jgi:hypothetical protein